MTSDLKLVVVQSPELHTSLESQFQKVFAIGTPADLARFLVQNDVDFIVVDEVHYEKVLFDKIFAKYKIPSVIIGGTGFSSKAVLGHTSEANLCEFVGKAKENFASLKIQRENTILNYCHQHLITFTKQVIQGTKDLFIAETKSFFKSEFKLERCHWVEVRNTFDKLPPILKLRNELTKQKVDQSTLIGRVDSCSKEWFACDDFQIWETHNASFMVLVWIPGPDQTSQCIVLSQLQVDDLMAFTRLLNLSMPFLKRRWNLCLTLQLAEEQVYKDGLTNLYNQKFLNEVLLKKIEENKRYKTPFSVLFIDVDHFKRVNDSLGHVVGSGVLGQMGDVLQAQIRNSDFGFRYGGDEFIIILSHTEGEDAMNVAERIRKKVENHQFDVNKVKVNITVSIGLAFYPEHAQSAEEIVKIADEAMYYGKNKSRNIVYKAS